MIYSDLKMDISKLTKDFLNNVDCVWNEIGWDENARSTSQTIIYEAVKNVYKNLLDKEKYYKKHLEEKIDELLLKHNKMIHSLQIETSFTVNSEPLLNAKIKIKKK